MKYISRENKRKTRLLFCPKIMYNHIRGETMEISIRKANKKDFQSINEIAIQEQDLHVELRPDLYKHSDTVITMKWFNELLDDGAILVGEIDNKIVSYAICFIKKWNDPLIISKKVMFIKSIANDKNYIGMGIGKKMMSYIMELAKEEKCDVIELQVNSKNKNATGFYEHLGMKEKSRIMELNL
jgi:ribosomal protein S18 acetylase RimI-like enzyme